MLFSREEFERLLMLVTGELFALEKHGKQYTDDYMRLKRMQNKLLKLVCNRKD